MHSTAVILTIVQSIGEWSNPSDEERARQERLHRRMMRRVKQVKQELEIPRRIPNFPRPPSLPIASAGIPDQPDDEIVSNPSDEEHGGYGDYYGPASAGRRPLPPLPHSRSASQYSAQTGHDPALAHSRNASEQYLTPGGLHPRPPKPAQAQPPSAGGRTDLNPFAKPFVFGASRQSGTWAPGAFGNASNASGGSTPAHVRAQSIGKPLNAAAQEFKPSSFNAAAPEFKPMGFTFRPPPGVPQLTFQAPQPPVVRPLPTPPAVPAPEPPRATQGREKRQRRSSDDIEGSDEDGVDTMTSFRFPPPGDSVPVRHSAPASPPVPTIPAPKEGSLNGLALRGHVCRLWCFPRRCEEP